MWWSKDLQMAIRATFTMLPFLSYSFLLLKMLPIHISPFPNMLSIRQAFTLLQQKRSSTSYLFMFRVALNKPFMITQTSTILAQALPVRIPFHINSTIQTGVCWRLSKGYGIMVHRLLKFLSCFVYFCFC